MKVIRWSEMQAAPVTEEGAQHTTIRWLISRADGAPNFAMRLFELAPDDYARLDKSLKDLARPAVTPTPAEEPPMQGQPQGMEILR